MVASTGRMERASADGIITGDETGRREEQHDVSGSTINVHLAPPSNSSKRPSHNSLNANGPNVTATSPTPPPANYTDTSSTSASEERARSSSIALSPTVRSSGSSSSHYNHAQNAGPSMTSLATSSGPSGPSGASTPHRDKERGTLGLGSFKSRFFPGPSQRSVSDYTGTQSHASSSSALGMTTGSAHGKGQGGAEVSPSKSMTGSMRKKSTASSGGGNRSGSGSDGYGARGSGSGSASGGSNVGDGGGHVNGADEQSAEYPHGHGVHGMTPTSGHLPRTPSRKGKKGASAPGTTTRLGLPATQTTSSSGSGSGSSQPIDSTTTSSSHLHVSSLRDPPSSTKKSPDKGQGTLRNSAAARFLRRVVSAPNTKALFGRDDASGGSPFGSGFGAGSGSSGGSGSNAALAPNTAVPGENGVPPLPLPAKDGPTSSPNPSRVSPVKVQGMTPMTIDLADPNESPSKYGTANGYGYGQGQAPNTAPVQYASNLAVPDTPSSAGSYTGAGLTPSGTRAHRALTASASPQRVAELQQTLGLGSPMPVPAIPGSDDASGVGAEGEADKAGPKAAFRRTYSSHSIKTRQVEVSPSSFQKIKLLGKGDVGKVYLVREKKSDKLFAMKGAYSFGLCELCGTKMLGEIGVI